MGRKREEITATLPEAGRARVVARFAELSGQPHAEPFRSPARHLLSDAERMARGRAQIAAGNFLVVDDVDAYFDSLVDVPPQ